MGKLYDYCQQLQQHIDSNADDVFRVRGQLALEVGFLVTLVEPDDPDEPQKIQALQDAAKKLFGLNLV